MTVLLTGARGFVGRQIATALAVQGKPVHAVTSSRSDPSIPVRAWHHVDLMDAVAVAAIMAEVKPTHLVHAAWDTTHGAFWTSDANYAWVCASLRLIRSFHDCGGQRVVIVGSCAEYDWQHGFCSEAVTPLNPVHPYGVCKAALFSMAQAYANSHGLSLAWPRIFLLYGPHEGRKRLVPSVVTALLEGRTAACTDGKQLRDVMHVADAGTAIAMLCDSKVTGGVNIGCGRPVALSDVAHEIARQIGRPDLLAMGALPSRPDDPPVLIPDTRKLNFEVGFNPRYDLVHGIADAIAFWRKQP